MGGKCGGFGVFEFIYSADWVVFYEKLLRFKLDQDSIWLTLDSDDLFIRISDEPIVRGYFSLFKESIRSKRDSLFSEVFFVFTKEDPN